MVNLPARTLTLLVAASRWIFVDEGMRIGGRDVVEVSTMVSFLGMVQLHVLMLAMARWGAMGMRSSIAHLWAQSWGPC